MPSQLKDKITWHVKNIDGLYRPSAERAGELRGVVKEVYDSLESKSTYGPLPKLIVGNLDADSIWEELQTRSRPLLRSVRKKVKGLEKHMQDVKEQEKRSSTKGSRNKNSEAESEDDDDVEDDEEEEESDEEEDSEEGRASPQQIEQGDSDDDIESRADQSDHSEDEDENRNEHEYEDENEGQGSDNDSPDEVFIDGMNDFLDEEEGRYEDLEKKREKLEKILAHGGIADDSNYDFSEDDEDFVARELYEEGEDDFDPRDLKYSDFFKGAPSKKSKHKGASNKVVGAKESPASGSDEDEEEDESEDEEDENEDEDEDEDEEEKPLTKKEKRKIQREKEIEELEKQLVGKKSWDLQGEVQAKERPENSLLEIHADIEKALKPAPLITEEYTSSLEEMIIKRITENNFDDVAASDMERGPREGGVDDFILSQDKSRQGLGEIYADDFMAKSSAQVESKAGDDENITNIKGLFHKICRQLDALSHFHYTPRPVVQEANVSSEIVPSISLEDVTPTTESAASAFTNSAPEKIHEKKRGRAAALVSEAEMTSDDRKRRRMASKSVRKKQRQSEDAKEHMLSNVGQSSAKYEKKKTEEILRNDKRVSVQRNSDSTDYTKSSKVFTQLQDQVRQDIRMKAGTMKKNKGKSENADDVDGPKPAWKL